MGGLWLSLGAVAFDLLLAIALTSLVRDRLSYRTWRAVHWLAYACWPVALWHGLGFPIIQPQVPLSLAAPARRAVRACPVLALRLQRTQENQREGSLRAS